MRISGELLAVVRDEDGSGQVRPDQVRRHLEHLGAGRDYKRPFLLTPDAKEPDMVRRLNDPSWSG